VEESVATLRAGGFDAVVFTSAPAASAWLRALADHGATEPVRAQVAAGRLLVAAVGPVTAEPLVVAGMDPVVPGRSRMGALVRQVVDDLGGPTRGVPTEAGRLRLRATAATVDDAVLDLPAPALEALARLLAAEGATLPGPVPDELTRVAGLLRRDPDGWALATVHLPVTP
jgi:uroporphyrinogen-III synthase